MSESVADTLLTQSVKYLDRDQTITRMNQYGRHHRPFFFMISYDTRQSVLIPRDSGDDHGILFSLPNIKNDDHLLPSHTSTFLTFIQTSETLYEFQFNRVQEELQKGNIYLLNLTQSSPVKSQASLLEIYKEARAKYKVYLPDQFVVFSPETFVRIFDGKIFTYPMKGTIRADIPHARELLRDNPKEQAEHASVVDLLRNDLGQVSESVRVKRYRYFEKVRAGQHELWQVSSEIEGILSKNYKDSLGDLIFQLLPAGSITGVPKMKAVEIIRRVENYDRGFYTGVCGYFDGKNLDSGVMIRFIEQTRDGLVYKSGGGIHNMSDMNAEFEELIQKIYVPVD